VKRKPRPPHYSCSRAVAVSFRNGTTRLRELNVAQRCRLIYKIVAGDEVHVIAFIHSARDLDAFLGKVDRL
jgi:hypothetical protein